MLPQLYRAPLSVLHPAAVLPTTVVVVDNMLALSSAPTIVALSMSPSRLGCPRASATATSASSLDTLLETLSPYAELPIEEAMTFPPQAYTSQELFELETATIFKPGWLCIAHISEVRSEGDYKTLDLLGELMVVVNSGDKVRVLSRICTHRWAPIVEVGKGCTKAFTCPFHHWTFALDGAWYEASSMTAYNLVDEMMHCLSVLLTAAPVSRSHPVQQGSASHGRKQPEFPAGRPPVAGV